MTFVRWFLLSAADGQRPRNYSSCCCCSWIFHLIYALSTSTTMLPPIFYKYFKSINPSSSIFFCQSINRPLPFPKYRYIIAADPGAGIGLVLIVKVFWWILPLSLKACFSWIRWNSSPPSILQKRMKNKITGWLDSNRGPLVPEAWATTTAHGVLLVMA